MAEPGVVDTLGGVAEINWVALGEHIAIIATEQTFPPLLGGKGTIAEAGRLAGLSLVEEDAEEGQEDDPSLELDSDEEDPDNSRAWTVVPSIFLRISYFYFRNNE